MAVDGLGVCLNQNQAFIGRHDIVIKVLDGAVAGCFHIKNSCDFFPVLNEYLTRRLPSLLIWV